MLSRMLSIIKVGGGLFVSLIGLFLAWVCNGFNIECIYIFLLKRAFGIGFAFSVLSY